VKSVISDPFFIGNLVGVGCRMIVVGRVWAHSWAHCSRCRCVSSEHTYLVPFVEEEHTVFLKTIIRSRKATKQ
jgi:hypothetical protein